MYMEEGICMCKEGYTCEKLYARAGGDRYVQDDKLTDLSPSS